MNVNFGAEIPRLDLDADVTTLAARWREWKMAAKYMITANGIINPERKEAILLHAGGIKLQQIYVTLPEPEVVETDTVFDIALKKLDAYFTPKANEPYERHKFRKMRQEENELVIQYVARLRRQADFCSFNEKDIQLRDQLIEGCRETRLRKLFLERGNDLDLETALKIGSSYEAVQTQVNEMNNETKTVNRVEDRRKTVRQWPKEKPKYENENTDCHRCGKKYHTADCCYYKNSACYNCGRIGHIGRMCRNKGKKSGYAGKIKKKPSNVHQVTVSNSAEVDSESETESDNKEVWSVFAVKNNKKAEEIKVNLQIHKCEVEMELDTGSAVSILPAHLYNKHLKDVPLKKSEILLKSYTDDIIPVIGEIEVDVQYESQVKKLPLVIVQQDSPPLMGRNWLREINLNWTLIKVIKNGGLDELLKRYSGLLCGTLGTVKGPKIELKMKEGAQPIYYKPRSVPYAMKEKIDSELDRLETLGIIEKVSYSDWATPVVPVIKPDGTVRLCGDYKVTVNKFLEIPEYPIPRPEELFTKLNGGQKFTKLDLSQAYQQVLLEDDSRVFTTINTHKGLYRYNRLPYGVSSAVSGFQAIMEKILQGLSVCIYLDDLVITGKDDEEHLNNLVLVFQRLEMYGIKLKKSKCHFMMDRIEYLGLWIDAEGVHPTDEKIEAVTRLSAPRNLDELRSFYGMIGYYRKFLPNLATVARPLSQLLSPKQKWNWTDECTKAFELVKEQLVSCELLVHYDPAKPVTLAVDASPYGLGAVISHVYDDGSEKPIAYASRTLTPAEVNYSQLEKEALAIIYGLRKFHEYLYMRKFTLITDNKPLSLILSPRKGIPSIAAARIQRWCIQLSAYTYDIEVKRSKDNGNADMLSRCPLKKEQKLPDKTYLVNWTDEANEVNEKQLGNLPPLVTASMISKVTQYDPLLSRVLHFIINGWPNSTDISEELKPYYTRREQLTSEQGCILWGIRVVIPDKYRKSILNVLHENHPGIVRMKALARLHLWWPNIDAMIEQKVRDCVICLDALPQASSSSVNPWLWPTKPWQRLHIDFATLKGKEYLIVVDARSKWPEVIPMKSTTADSTITAMRNIFATHGLCETIVSDNGPQFTSHQFKTFLRSNGIQHILSSPYHPASNGEAERFVRTFKTYMKTSAGKPENTEHKIGEFLLTYRTTPHCTTKTSPDVLLYGRQLRTRLSAVRPNLTDKMQKVPVNREKHNIREFEIGERVMARDYRKPKACWINGVIVAKLGPMTYKVQVDELIWKRHVDQLRDISLSNAQFASEIEDTKWIPPLSTLQPVIRQELPANVPNGEHDKIELPVTKARDSPVMRQSDRLRKKPERLIENM